MEVRDRIRILRNFKKLSTHALAKMTGISQPILSRMESGQRKITVEDVAVIAQALEIPVEALFYDEEMLKIMRGGEPID